MAALSQDICDVMTETQKWLQDISSENIYLKNVNDKPFPREWLVTPCLSPCIKKAAQTDHNIILIQQFFIHSDPNRQNEIRNCLKYNCYNNHISKIILLNEKIYSPDELGVQNDKVEQVVINDRLTFKIAFEYVQKTCLDSTIILANSDIFFDGNIINANSVGLHQSSSILCQSRIEYRLEKNLSDCIGIDRHDSQDVWIWNTKAINLDCNQLKLIDFALGKPGCDNRFIFVMDLLSITPFNMPLLVKCYHYHNVNIRNYGIKDRVDPEYLGLFPNVKQIDLYNTKNSSFLNSVDSFRFLNLVKTSKNTINTIRLFNKDAILFLQIIANLKNPSSAATIIQFAQSNGLNVASGQELNYWLTTIHDSLSTVDIFMLTNPLAKTEQHEDNALNSFYTIYKNKNTFNDSILHWYIGNKQDWLSNKDVVVVSPYNDYLRKSDTNTISCDSLSFIDINIQLKATDMVNDIVTNIKQHIIILENPIILLCTELYDTAVSGILKKENISSIVFGEYIFGYFNIISSHPQKTWHKLINQVYIDTLIQLSDQ